MGPFQFYRPSIFTVLAPPYLFFHLIPKIKALFLLRYMFRRFTILDRPPALPVYRI